MPLGARQTKPQASTLPTRDWCGFCKAKSSFWVPSEDSGVSGFLLADTEHTGGSCLQNPQGSAHQDGQFGWLVQCHLAPDSRQETANPWLISHAWMTKSYFFPEISVECNPSQKTSFLYSSLSTNFLTTSSSFFTAVKSSFWGSMPSEWTLHGRSAELQTLSKA